MPAGTCHRKQTHNDCCHRTCRRFRCLCPTRPCRGIDARRVAARRSTISRARARPTWRSTRRLPRHVRPATSLPTLRFYQWKPPAVSLGRHQPHAEIDHAAVAAAGYEIVRRPTGGRAILHTDEFTYSVAAAQNEARLAGGVMDCLSQYQQCAAGGAAAAGRNGREGAGLGARRQRRLGRLLRGAQRLRDHRRRAQVDGQCAKPPRRLRAPARQPAAGRRHHPADRRACAGTCRQRKSLRADLAARACTLAQALGVPDDSPEVQFAAVCAAMRQGFEETLALDASSLPNCRRANCAVPPCLIREQFANDEWTNQR